MLERIFGRISSLALTTKPSRDYLVTFTGGMGAQIISAAIYFDMINAGCSVHADMSYFEAEPYRAKEGDLGKCSQWAWQLDCFGMLKDSFHVADVIKNYKTNVFRDGAEKLRLGIEALTKPEIQNLFNVGNDWLDNCTSIIQDKYLCVHIRRGDYLNVASHIISDAEFISILSQFKKIINSIVIISDSKLPEHLKMAIANKFNNIKYLDNIDAVESHIIMRYATILVCSNSQFSLAAAALNREGLKIVPKQWFKGEDRQIEAVVNMKCQFQVFQI